MILCQGIFAGFLQAQDWPGLNRYKQENEALGLPKPGEQRVVLMGNSITERWGMIDPQFFSDHKYINRGISGQTTPQMLIRFRADVVKLKPALVVILAGTNDIAGNTGPSSLGMIMDNIISMCQLARANHIKVILCSVLPSVHYFWKPKMHPEDKIIALNKQIKAYSNEHHIFYLDYYPLMVDAQKGMKPAYTPDGTHPDLAGYKVMEPLCIQAIDKVLTEKD